MVGKFINRTKAKPPWMVREEQREAQTDDAFRGQAPCKQADLMATNLPGPEPVTLLLQERTK